jgi:5-methylcytosine-specific restriction protein A
MPYKPQKPCRQPGCPNLTNKTYCEHHIKTNRRESAHERGYTSKWRKLSKLYLKSHPLCTECNRHGKLTPATVVDHITPHRGNPQLMWSEGNWQSLCKRCHNKKTGKYDSRPTYGY